MSKGFLYIDESKRLREGKIIFGMIKADISIANFNKISGEIIDSLGIGNGPEIKSTNGSGEIFYEKNGFKTLKSKVGVNFYGTVYEEYRDTPEFYQGGLVEFIKDSLDSCENTYTDLDIYVDKSSLMLNIKLREKEIAKYLGVQRVSIYAKDSKTNRALQIADLVTGKMKEYFSFGKLSRLDIVFQGIPWKIPKKSPSAVTSLSTLVVWTP